VKTVPANIKKALEELIAPKRDARKAMAYVTSAKMKAK
jgi:hypothetical protein